MQVGVLGVSHKSAPLLLREQVAHACPAEGGKVILSTCNRTEIYFSGENLADVQCQVFAELKTRLSHSSEHAFYSFFGEECFYHLACVTAGVDSKLLAESDVQRQVKLAYETARSRSSLSPALHYLFQKSLKVAKEARSRFSLFKRAIHLEGMVYQIVGSILHQTPSILFIGNSEINRKIIHYFSQRKKGRLTLISRNLEAAHPFALDYGLTLKNRDELAHAHAYDAIISATVAEGYLLTSLASSRQTRLILDLSVPRTIHPDLGLDPSLTLMNMEHIGECFAGAATARSLEVAEVRQFLASRAHAYTERFALKTARCESSKITGHLFLS
jgi:glutamyl-tRNA reductase